MGNGELTIYSLIHWDSFSIASSKKALVKKLVI
jgi:hypothetical protein